jgi:hypothetical protein
VTIRAGCDAAPTMTDTNRHPDRSGQLVTFHPIHEPGCPTDPVARRRTLAAGKCDRCAAAIMEVGVACTTPDGTVSRASMAEAIKRADELAARGRQQLAIVRSREAW